MGSFQRSIVLPLLALTLCSCGERRDKVLMVSGSDAEMNAAMAHARQHQ